ncbi:MAG: BTAD domain-containing putative transcriptional regulator [Actinomycetota bacterium]
MTAVEPIIDLRLLGPLTVSVDGAQVSVGGPRQMAVLARLMLTPDQTVTMGQLVESVWDGEEPSQPHIAIRSYVSNLRRAIEPNRRRRAADSCLANSPPGYRLAIAPDAVDWVRFEGLVTEGRDALADGDHGRAVIRLRRSMGLWKGEPCAGLPDSHPFQAHRSRLTTLRETAQELLFEALLLQGDHPAVVAEIEAAIDEHPLRERLTELGMVAFYRAGRQSDALALGQRLRARLRDELGIDPSPSIEEIELRILTHDASLAPSARTTERPPDRRPGPFEDDDGVGTVGGLAAAVPLDDNRPATPASDGTTGEVAEPVIDLTALQAGPIGRGEELRILRSVGERLSTGSSAAAIITGEEGVGKTTLVRAVADQLVGDGATVAWARSIDGPAAPLWPWSQAVLSLLEQEDAPSLTPDLAALAGLGPSMAAGFPSAPLVDATDADVVLAIATLLRRRAASGPVLLIFEDLQWADTTTVSAIQYVAAALTDVPVGIILTWRETDPAVDVAGPGLRELSRLPWLIRLELEGLEDAAILELARAIGRPLSAEQTELLHWRCDGNPLYLREILAHPQLTPTVGRRRTALIDVVLDRVSRLHPGATPVLTAAAVADRPFTAQFVADLTGEDAGSVRTVLSAAVRGGVLDEAEPLDGTFRFHHPVVAEVLSAEPLAGDLAAMHRDAGHRILAEEGPGPDAARHLADSPDPEDRLMAARIAIDVVDGGAALPDVTTLDRIVAAARRTVEEHPGIGSDTLLDGLVVDLARYDAWRAWTVGAINRWSDLVVAALVAATEAVDRAEDDAERERHVRRLVATTALAAGQPTWPVGASRTPALVEDTAAIQAALGAAVDRLDQDEDARWAAQLRLRILSGEERPGTGSRRKALRDALKTVGSARRRLGPTGVVPTLEALVDGFADVMEPGDRLKILDEIVEHRPGPSSRLTRARVGHVALLEQGQTWDAEQLVARTVASTADDREDPYRSTSAGMLWVRHHLWVGDLDRAEEAIGAALGRWSITDLGPPIPLLRQIRTLRALRRVSLRADGGPPTALHPTEGLSAAELGFRFARIGDTSRAVQCLDRAVEEIGVRRMPLADRAFLAMAAAMVGHEPGAVAVFDLLEEAEDRLVTHADGSVIYGPASLFAGVAAAVAGRREVARARLDHAARAVERTGGAMSWFDLVVGLLDGVADSNRPPTET